jgi:ubiquinone/menaquinone biosynthesis C-methylase UbiE
MQKARLMEFGRIDQTGTPAHFIHFLDAACAAASFQAYKRRMNELLGLAPGKTVLDMGCGTGDDVREMARLVGEQGKVVGVDNSQAMIAEAENRAAHSNLPVSFQFAEASRLPFPDGSFDGSRADRSLMHVPDARQAIAEMARVTKTEGPVVVFEVDFETLTIDTDERVTARKVLRTWTDIFRNGWLGRHVPALFRELGLSDITVIPYVLQLTPTLALPILGAATVEKAVEKGTLTAGEGQGWLQHLAELQRTERFFSTMTGFLVAGRK